MFIDKLRIGNILAMTLASCQNADSFRFVSDSMAFLILSRDLIIESHDHHYLLLNLCRADFIS